MILSYDDCEMGIRTSSLPDENNNGYGNDLDSDTLTTLGSGKDECKMEVTSDEKIGKEGIMTMVSGDIDEVEGLRGKSRHTTSKEMGGEHEAAVKLQKVYKSFRTRRKLADCAVIVEQGWWKLIDFMELEHSSLLFFDTDKHESAVSRWSRAKTRAAKVGKGLSKNKKARKLALQHWLEAIDPRHRYGHNLHFYYIKWLETQSKQPFFYWLDVGEGKKENLEKCPRSKLQQECVQYLGPIERKAYEVTLQDGKLHYRQTGEAIHTTGKEKSGKWIFVLSTSKVLYVGKKRKGRFQHSSFLAGGVTIAAGRLVVEHGVLKAVWPHSGHYQPTQENFEDFLTFLRENNIDLTDVKTSSTDEDEEDTITGNKMRTHVRDNSFDMDITETLHSIAMIEGTAEDLISEETQEEDQQNEYYVEDEAENSQISPLQVRDKEREDGETDEAKEGVEEDSLRPKRELLEEDVTVSRDSIVKRMSSKRETGSYQLGKQLSCRWTTGAGPRIGCVRDYPSEMQFMALEQLRLSPNPTLCSKDTASV